MILVTSATGKTGSRVLAQLLRRGEHVRAQIHDSAKVDQIPDEAEVVVCSFEEPEAWDAAVSGCSGVYLASPAGPHQRTQEGIVINAVVRGGADAHVVKVASMGLDDPSAGRIAQQHQRLRGDLRASGLPWTVLAISQLMDNVKLYLEPARSGGVLPVPAGDARICWVDADDVAATAVTVLSAGSHTGRTLEVTGPQALHHRDVAALLGTHLARDVAYVDVPPEQALAAMTAAGLDPWVAAGLVETNIWFRNGGASEPTDIVSAVAGRPPTTLEDYLNRLSREEAPEPRPASVQGRSR